MKKEKTEAVGADFIASEENENADRIIVSKPEGKIPLWDPIA
jgi:hypothetical protein